MSSSPGATPCAAAASNSRSIPLDSDDMPIYEYRCEGCDERFEELLSMTDERTPACPKCGGAKVTRLLSRINTEWLPGDVAWDRVGRSFD